MMSNRKIKFRVWDSINKKFDAQIYNVGEQFGHPSSCDWYPQQYTGLKDYNGKEIYEGDIIEYSQTTIEKICNKQQSITDFSNPILGKSNIRKFIGEVVFDKINDVDDFYTPTMLAWGIKY